MHRLKEYIDRFFRRYVSPVFMMLLFVSFVLWYITKLSYTYTTEMPVTIQVDGARFRVVCLVEGRGSRLFAHRFYLSEKMRVSLKDLVVTPSESLPGAIVIDPASLRSLIAVRHPDLKILSIGPLPEIPLEHAAAPQ